MSQDPILLGSLAFPSRMGKTLGFPKVSVALSVWAEWLSGLQYPRQGDPEAQDAH